MELQGETFPTSFSVDVRGTPLEMNAVYWVIAAEGLMRQQVLLYSEERITKPAAEI